MANSFQQAGASQEPSPSAPLYTSRIFTGWFTNRSPLRDGVTTNYMEKAGFGRQDAILNGQNMEITPRLTLGRRAGCSQWGGNFGYKRVNRFYSFNTFTLTNEVIRVMVDTSNAVYDAFDGSQQNLIWTKSANNPTYFLGVGNILYFTNGVDNKQWVYGQGVYNWGIAAPTAAPSAQFNFDYAYGAWQANVVFSRNNSFAPILILDPNANVQNISTYGTSGQGSSLTWDTRPNYGTQDGTAAWQNLGNGVWAPNTFYNQYTIVYNQSSDGNVYFYQSQNAATSSGGGVNWLSGLGSTSTDGGVNWLNLGRIMNRAQIGDNTLIVATNTILDASSNVQTCMQAGRSGASAPSFSSIKSAYTSDPSGNALGAVIWQNTGAIAAVQYGYAFMNSKTGDVSNMSPSSVAISANDGHKIIVSGTGSGDSQVDTIILYRTLHGGSTYFYLTQFANPGGNQPWSYTDTTLDANLNITWEALVTGEGTPLPSGATCLAYHLGRIFAAVGNVVWASAGPDAAFANTSGNAGFAISFTCQSKVIRLWPTSLGLVVFTVRDAYLIQGNGVDMSAGGTGLFITVWIENLPLLNYDAFTTFGTTGFLYTGKNMVISLDPGAGIVEVSQPIADVLENLDPRTAYLTYHSHNSRDTALYLGNGQDTWYRLNPSIAPESGFAWSLPAYPVMGMSALQSVEVSPGVYQLLMGPKTDGGQISYRNTATRADNGMVFSSYADFGVITLASPGQMAGIGWMNLEAWNTQNEPMLSMLLGELQEGTDTPLELVKRTRHDPPNLPMSTTLDSTRYTFLRGGSPIWCRHLIFRVDFGSSNTFDELLSFTIFGAVYQEFAA